MGIIIEETAFDPALKHAIAAFIDAHFEEQDYDEGPASPYTPAFMAASPERAEPKRAGAGRITGMLGRIRESREAAAERLAPASWDGDSAIVAEEETAARTAFSAPERQSAVLADGMTCGSGATGDLKTWLEQVDEPFSTTLLALIGRKGLSDTDVYKRAHMSRQLFSRIRGDAAYRPAKKTVLALSIAMQLSLEEMRDLLERAGFALSRSSKRDVIVEYFVTNGIYDLFAINEALYEFDQPLI